MIREVIDVGIGFFSGVALTVWFTRWCFKEVDRRSPAPVRVNPYFYWLMREKWEYMNGTKDEMLSLTDRHKREGKVH